MAVSQKLLLALAVFFQLIVTLTGLGLVIGSTKPTALAGFILLLPCFALFAGADSILERLKIIRSTANSHRFGFFLDDRSKRIVDFLASLPTEATLLTRAFFLSASFWIVDLFVALCSGGLPAFADQIRKNLMLTALSLAASVLDATRGKSVSHPGLLSKLLATFGSVQFYRGFYLLGAALLGTQAFRAVEYLFSNPFWFLSVEERLHLGYLSRLHDYSPLTILFGFLPLFLLFPTLAISGRSAKGDADRKYLGWGLIITLAWLLSYPVYQVCAFIYFMIVTFQQSR